MDEKKSETKKAFKVWVVGREDPHIWVMSIPQYNLTHERVSKTIDAGMTTVGVGGMTIMVDKIVMFE